jgi:Na+/H+-dicarboxylate symporter
MSKSVSIFVGLMLGLAFGASLSYSGSSVLKGVLLLTEPLGLIWINAIRMTVIPLLVALLVTSIAGRRETGLVARIGIQTFGLFFFLVAISGLTALVVAPYLLQSIAISPDAVEILITSEAPNSERFQNLPNFKDWLVNLIPVNPIAAAAEGALLSLMIFTGLFSLALSSLQIEVKDTVISVFVGIKEAMLVLIGWVMAFAPIGVFSLVFSFSSSLGVSAIAALSSFVFIAVCLVLLITGFLYPIAVVGGGVSLRKFAFSCLPAQVVGFSTRSSVAALPATYTATKSLGISADLSGVVLPLAIAFLKYATPVARTTGAYFIAMLYGIDLAFYLLFILAASISLLSFYTPGIPSASLLIMTPIFLSLGLPVEGIGILIGVDFIVDMFLTMSNVTANIATVTVMSRKDKSNV